MADHMKHIVKHINTTVQYSQKVGNPRKAAGSLKERVAALGSPLLSVLANLHHLMGTLMRVMLLMGGVGVVSGGMQIPPWIRRGLLVMALLTAGFTVYRMLSRKQGRWMLLFSGGSVLFTAGMIIWSIATFGF